MARFPLAFSRLVQKRKVTEEQGYLDVTRDIIENGYMESNNQPDRCRHQACRGKTIPVLASKPNVAAPHYKEALPQGNRRGAIMVRPRINGFQGPRSERSEYLEGEHVRVNSSTDVASLNTMKERSGRASQPAHSSRRVSGTCQLKRCR